jgi:hypothetical protein
MESRDHSEDRPSLSKCPAGARRSTHLDYAVRLSSFPWAPGHNKSSGLATKIDE